jgi:hypothetical protein
VSDERAKEALGRRHAGFGAGVDGNDDLGEVGERGGGIVDHGDDHRAPRARVIGGGEQIGAAARLRDGDQRHVAEMGRGGAIERTDRRGMADRGHAGFRFQQELGEGGGLIGAAARQRRREGRGERAQALAGLADQIGIKLELRAHNAGADSASAAIRVAPGASVSMVRESRSCA